MNDRFGRHNVHVKQIGFIILLSKGLRIEMVILDQIGSDWIILDHIGSDWIRLDHIVSIILDHIGSSWIILDHLESYLV